MFIKNEYLEEYWRIIKNSKGQIVEGYSEIHHIIPRSFFDKDDLKQHYSKNKVILSADDHFRVHLLLPLFLRGTQKDKMTLAVNGMINRGKQGIVLSPEDYKKVRMEAKEILSALTSKQMKEIQPNGKSLASNIATKANSKWKSTIMDDGRTKREHMEDKRQKTLSEIEDNGKSKLQNLIRKGADTAIKNGSQAGENNPVAKLCKIYDENDEFVYEARGDLQRWCKDTGVIYGNALNCLNTGDEMYKDLDKRTKAIVTRLKNRGLLKFAGWKFIKIEKEMNE